ncbi:hypothetical protein JHK85_007830 [Glycine max]|nr:hypothetical protein JHK85_007830 [Glycine max]KAG5072391.1 hypothetical protein JHK86_007602 [Glycine max]KHN10690.1 BI1-like protein [Glycine soja]
MILSENAIRIANYFLMWLETEYGENYSDIYYINYGGGGALLAILIFCLIQMFYPGKLSQTIYGCGASIVFCGYIIYDTERLIKRFSYEEQIWASVSLYADIINLFVSLLTAFRAAN